ncbi:hypothetical protein RMSM_07304 [Rhodopirellula maiorica SM1]|uniref:Uncharacterized protein n=1 Tax=Rhodopirellula maiorica SM1 TaxID=1265738 RepID=M5RK93_9BACT|nr:hypothetical protein [Rhodopirellula maiorica]EMI15777.1 hypothetical protein RMSM_07304 [Rhodopirellula maiorica SM1]
MSTATSRTFASPVSRLLHTIHRIGLKFLCTLDRAEKQMLRSGAAVAPTERNPIVPVDHQ